MGLFLNYNKYTFIYGITFKLQNNNIINKYTFNYGITFKLQNNN